MLPLKWTVRQVYWWGSTHDEHHTTVTFPNGTEWQFAVIEKVDGGYGWGGDCTDYPDPYQARAAAERFVQAADQLFQEAPHARSLTEAVLAAPVFALSNVAEVLANHVCRLAWIEVAAAHLELALTKARGALAYVIPGNVWAEFERRRAGSEPCRVDDDRGLTLLEGTSTRAR